MMDIKQAKNWLKQVLPAPEAGREAEILLRQLLAVSRAYLITHDDQLLTSEQLSQLQLWVSRRQQGEPLAYIVGNTEFYGLSFMVNSSVLIPRADTELLIDLTMDAITNRQRNGSGNVLNILDMGTGSGAIAVTLAVNCAECQITALDVSEAALAVARYNAEQHDVTVKFERSSWFEHLAQQQFDIIVSNPPYIAEDDPHLVQTSLPFEPQLALTSGVDGLTAIRHIIEQSRAWLVPNGCLLLEHGYDQAQAVQSLLHQQGFTQICSSQDLGGNDRVTQGVFLSA